MLHCEILHVLLPNRLTSIRALGRRSATWFILRIKTSPKDWKVDIICSFSTRFQPGCQGAARSLTSAPAHLSPAAGRVLVDAKTCCRNDSTSVVAGNRRRFRKENDRPYETHGARADCNDSDVLAYRLLQVLGPQCIHMCICIQRERESDRPSLTGLAMYQNPIKRIIL